MNKRLKVGDAVEFDGERGTVIADEKDGLVCVFIDPDREEFWTAEHCTLVLRPTGGK